MQPLQKIIRDEINQNGFITIARYMELALYHPQFGYYMTRDPFGVKGDFTTAPEISQMFGELIGAWVVDAWLQMGSPVAFQLVECGAGRGTLMHDILRATRNVNDFQNTVQIGLIECSPYLINIQKQKLAEYQVEWFDNIQQIKEIPSIIIGNEFFDALPARQFKKYGEHWFERVIENSFENGFFEFSEVKCLEYPEDLPKYGIRQNAIYEVNQAQKEFIESVSAKLKKSGGVMLMIDYGYVEGNGGETLQAIKDHDFVNVLENVGEADITSHVNFKNIEKYILSHGLKCHGIREQGAFLNHLGIEARARKLSASAYNIEDKEQAKQSLENIETAKRRLTDRDQMGSLFKVIVASYGFDFKCSGF